MNKFCTILPDIASCFERDFKKIGLKFYFIKTKIRSAKSERQLETLNVCKEDARYFCLKHGMFAPIASVFLSDLALCLAAYGIVT